jgi:cobalt-zinc-cadmium efflux system outer membrane protein
VKPLGRALLTAGVLVALAGGARAQELRRVSLDEVLRAARAASPDLVVARSRESVAQAEVGIAGAYPNPSVAAGTTTRTAKFTAGVSVPLIVLGQRGAAIDAARADASTVALDTEVAWTDVRQAAERAYVALWLAEGVASARRDAAAIQAKLEDAVTQRVQVGSAPQLDALRVHAEKVRADADAVDSSAQVLVAGTALGRWMGEGDGAGLRTQGAPPVPEDVPTLSALLARLGTGARIRREQADVRAAEARASRERAFVRPSMTVDLGADFGDETLCNGPCSSPPVNYRAQLSLEVPVWNFRGPYVDRELRLGDVARARLQAAHVQGTAELSAAYHAFEAATEVSRSLQGSVLPAALGAAGATEEAYGLGRAQLLAVLDAERALIEARVNAIEAQAAQAAAWVDVEHALGAP